MNSISELISVFSCSIFFPSSSGNRDALLQRSDGQVGSTDREGAIHVCHRKRTSSRGLLHCRHFRNHMQDAHARLALRLLHIR